MKKLMWSAAVDGVTSAAVVALWRAVSVDPVRGFLAASVLAACVALLLDVHDRMSAQRAQ